MKRDDQKQCDRNFDFPEKMPPNRPVCNTLIRSITFFGNLEAFYWCDQLMILHVKLRRDAGRPLSCTKITFLWKIWVKLAKGARSSVTKAVPPSRRFWGKPQRAFDDPESSQSQRGGPTKCLLRVNRTFRAFGPALVHPGWVVETSILAVALQSLSGRREVYRH